MSSFSLSSAQCWLLRGACSCVEVLLCLQSDSFQESEPRCGRLCVTAGTWLCSAVCGSRMRLQKSDLGAESVLRLIVGRCVVLWEGPLRSLGCCPL